MDYIYLLEGYQIESYKVFYSETMLDIIFP